MSNTPAPLSWLGKFFVLPSPPACHPVMELLAVDRRTLQCLFGDGDMIKSKAYRRMCPPVWWSFGFVVGPDVLGPFDSMEEAKKAKEQER